ncbi:putative membrane protein [Candidatus Magnetomoraceae bacterium gMMP-1]
MFLDKLLTTIVLIIAFYILFFIGKLIHDLLHKEYNLNYELVESDNPALALAIAGYYFGLVIALGGALIGPSSGIIGDLIDMTMYGVLAIILLNASWFCCDHIILSRFKITDELIRDRNEGTGAVSCGVSIASGLVIYGAVSGEGGNIWTAIIFWVIGQVMLVLASWVYNIITPYCIHDEIEKDNIAAGVSFAGALIAIGIIVGLAAEGDFESWSKDLPKFITIALSGLVLLPVIRFLTDKVLFPTVNLTDEIANQEIPNVGAAYIEAFSYIAAAFIIYWCV